MYYNNKFVSTRRVDSNAVIVLYRYRGHARAGDCVCGRGVVSVWVAADGDLPANLWTVELSDGQMTTNALPHFSPTSLTGFIYFTTVSFYCTRPNARSHQVQSI